MSICRFRICCTRLAGSDGLSKSAARLFLVEPLPILNRDSKGISIENIAKKLINEHYGRLASP
jgi:hypothetical protein